MAGFVGLVVIAVVATLLKVEELIPVRSRLIDVLWARNGRGPGGAGAAIPAAEPEHDTLDARPAAGEVMAGVAAVGSSAPAGTVFNQSSSREQVSNPVPNDSGGPGAGRAADQAASKMTADDQPTVATATDDAPTVVVPAADQPGAAELIAAEPNDAELRSMLRGGLAPDQAHTLFDEPAADRTLPVTASAAAAQAAARANPGYAQELTPGTTVGGRYRLISLVSEDGAGHWFWRAKDTVLPRDMAVTMLPDTSGASATVARTLRAGRLHHIGLPQTLDVGTDHGQSYVVGQWVDGATLTDLVSGGPLEADVAASITAKLSEAVAEAHRNGIAFGALNPSLIRVNFDGQVRLSHVIAHGAATTDQDIRAIGALLYLMLTGTWPLGDPVEPGAGIIAAGELPAAPTSLGRELPAWEVNSSVPEALSALAARALHPEEPDGIHAVGAIAALLRSPDVVGPARPAPAAEARPLSASDRRLIKERRVKLSLAAVVLSVFAVLIIIALGGLTNQVVASFQNSAPDELPIIDSAAASAQAGPTSAAGTSAPKPSAASSAAAPAAGGPVPIVGGTVYDPQGDGSPDYKDYVDRAFDGNQESAWLTWVYKQQFPTLKTGVGLLLEFDHEVTPTSVNIKSTTNGAAGTTNGTVVEVRSATSPTATFDQTKVVGTGTVNNGGVDIPLTNAPKSKYLLVFITQLSPTPDNQFQGKINEVTVLGS